MVLGRETWPPDSYAFSILRASSLVDILFTALSLGMFMGCKCIILYCNSYVYAKQTYDSYALLSPPLDVQSLPTGLAPAADQELVYIAPASLCIGSACVINTTLRISQLSNLDRS